MRSILVVMAMITSLQTFAQRSFDISKDKENGSTVYQGQITFTDLHEQLSFTWLDKGVKEYKPDSNQINFLKKNLGNYTMTVFMGTWCSDSHDMIPRLYKVLTMVNYPMSQYLMYGVNREKHAQGGEEKLYRITNVPAIILYKKNHEVGRITEMVNKSVEADLQAIIEKDLAQKH